MSLDKIRGDAIDFDMTGLSVVDFGGYDGHFAKGCCDRGARDVTVVDSGEWKEYAWSKPTATAEQLWLARERAKWGELRANGVPA